MISFLLLKSKCMYVMLLITVSYTDVISLNWFTGFYIDATESYHFDLYMCTFLIYITNVIFVILIQQVYRWMIFGPAIHTNVIFLLWFTDLYMWYTLVLQPLYLISNVLIYRYLHTCNTSNSGRMELYTLILQPIFLISYVLIYRYLHTCNSSNRGSVQREIACSIFIYNICLFYVSIYLFHISIPLYSLSFSLSLYIWIYICTNIYIYMHLYI